MLSGNTFGNMRGYSARAEIFGIPFQTENSATSHAGGELRAIGQFGTTIGIGLLFDSFVVRSLITPSIMTVMGRWFWWPKRVRVRPASQMLRSVGPRLLVRALLYQPRQSCPPDPQT